MTNMLLTAATYFSSAQLIALPSARSGRVPFTGTAARINAATVPANRTVVNTNTGCTDVGFDFASAGLSCVDVSFNSSGTHSGAITLYGSIIKPLKANGATPPGAVLVAGSGPNNRWEDITNLGTRTLLDVGVAMAKRGVTVLTYDKRTCSAAPFCVAREFCVPVAQGNIPACSACKGCVNLYAPTLWDFAADAAAALTYLATQSVDPNSLTVAGHSQGCTIAPLAAKAGNAKNIGLLEGDGQTISKVVVEQTAFQLPATLAALVAARAAGDKTLVTDLEGEVAAAQCTIAHAQSQFDLVASGKIAGYYDTALQIPAYAAPYGAYVSKASYEALKAELGPTGGLVLAELGIEPNTTFCAPAEIDGTSCLCTEEFVTTSKKCALMCQKASLLASGGPTSWGAPFTSSWLEVGTAPARAKAWAALAPGTRILSTNGWADGNVPTAAFVPEHAVIMANASRANYAAVPYPAAVFSTGAASYTAHTFANITHEMIDVTQAGSPPFYVRSDVLGAITSWMCDGIACSVAAPPAPPASDDDMLGQAPLNSAGSVPFVSPALAAVGGAMAAWATVGAYAVVTQRRRRPKLSLALLTDVTSEDAPLRMS